MDNSFIRILRIWNSIWVLVINIYSVIVVKAITDFFEFVYIITNFIGNILIGCGKDVTDKVYLILNNNTL